MNYENNLFKLFGGIRPMARALGEPSSNVDSWRRVGRIPAEKQPHVLAVAKTLGLAVTADNIIFPLGSKEASDRVATQATGKPNQSTGSQAQSL